MAAQTAEMSSKTVRALYRLFLRQCRDLERQQLESLSMRMPVNKGRLVPPLPPPPPPQPRLPAACHCQDAIAWLPPSVKMSLPDRQMPFELMAGRDFHPTRAPPGRAEAWMTGGQHGWAPPPADFYLQSFQSLAPLAAQVR